MEICDFDSYSFNFSLNFIKMVISKAKSLRQFSSVKELFLQIKYCEYRIIEDVILNDLSEDSAINIDLFI